MNSLQRYEIIRPILKGEKTPKQVSEETGVPLSTIYYYLKLLRESGGDIKSLEDKSYIAFPEDCPVTFLKLGYLRAIEDIASGCGIVEQSQDVQQG